MADSLDAVEVINGVADNSSDIRLVAALREAQTALRRLAAIKAQHHKHETTTDGGNIVHPSIGGSLMHRLLYGPIDEI